MGDGAAESRGEEARLSAFLGERKRLLRLAYRYLGSVSEAEDAVQDAWLRFAASAEDPDHAGRYLSRIVTNLCLDRLKAARARRERYVGPWLPEPLVEAAGAVEPDTSDAALDISFGVMRALERLSPLERAALFLHDLYDLSFEEVGETLKRSPAACRQMASRARRSLRQGGARFQPSEADVARFVAGFAETARTGDVEPLKKLLAADVDFVSDGGGKVTAALNVVSGADKVARLLLGLSRKSAARASVSILPAAINGGPGLIVRLDRRIDHTMAFSVDGAGAIAAIYVVRNPDKLRAVPQAGEP
ncbi:MAG TPA: RNA polymerase sigma factor SigJ [Rhizobiales bacterium]|nr:RNA polymerase sigma factor SigJ [Hyphomicrobiales bacterium]